MTTKYNDQLKKDKRTNNDIQNIAQKTKDGAMIFPQIHGMICGAPEG
jgi:hypothetical protein